MSQNPKKSSKKTPNDIAQEFAATQPREQQAYAAFCFAQGYAAGHRARIEESASLQAVEEEALAQIPEGPWRELMQTWLDYKRSIKKRYTLVSSIAGCFEELHTQSGGDIDIARQYVQRSINSGYIGIAFPNNGQPHNATPPPYPAGSRAEQRKEEVRQLSRMASAGASALAAIGFGAEEE